MREVEAVLFDLDGTLANTAGHIYESYRRTMESAGLPSFPRERIMSLTAGKTLNESYRAFCPNLNKEEIEALYLKHLEIELGTYDLCVEFPGITETLIELRKSGIKLAIVTSRSKKSTDMVMAVLQISELFDAVVTRDDCPENLKPHPRPVLLALEKLHVPPDRAIMVGDSSGDIYSAQAAKLLATIGVLYGFEGEGIRKSNPDYIVDFSTTIAPLILNTIRMLAK